MVTLLYFSYCPPLLLNCPQVGRRPHVGNHCCRGYTRGRSRPIMQTRCHRDIVLIASYDTQGNGAIRILFDQLVQFELRQKKWPKHQIRNFLSFSMVSIVNLYLLRKKSQYASLEIFHYLKKKFCQNISENRPTY